VNNLFLTEENNGNVLLNSKDGQNLGIFCKDFDGFYKFILNTNNKGFFDEQLLGHLYDIIVRLNKPAKEELDQYFDGINVEAPKDA
jgi:hypothetical protein